MLLIDTPLHLLWLLPVGVLALAWIRSPMFLSALGKRMLMWLKISIAVLFILAMLNPRWVTERDPEETQLVFLVDSSASVATESILLTLEQIASISSHLPAGQQVTLLSFHHETALIDPIPNLKAIGEDLIAAWRSPVGAPTDIGKALEAAGQYFPPGKKGRVVLCSDGLDRTDSLLDRLSAFRKRGIPIHVLPMAVQPPPEEPLIHRISAPEEVFLGDECFVDVLVKAPLNKRIEVTLKSGGHLVGTQHRISTQQMLPLRFSYRPKAVGPQGIEVGVTAGASTHEDHRAAVILVKRLPQVLLFATSEAEATFLNNTLVQEGFPTTLATPASWPQRLSDTLQRHSCVIFHNIHRKHFSDSEMSLLQRSVQGGMGALMTGGPHSFGLGDFTDTPIEKAMPVRMPRRTVSGGLALVLVLDASGSMYGDGWNNLVVAAKDIVHLARGKQLGIVLFNQFPVWAVPIQQVNDPDRICAELDQYYPRGGTVFSLPLGEALQELKQLHAGRKSILMMSDGEPSDYQYVPNMFPEFQREGITVSTFAVGRNVNPRPLEEIAAATNGNFYESSNFSEMSRMFQQEFKRLAAPPVEEEDFVPVQARRHPMTAGLNPKQYPKIGGLVLTQAKEGALVVLAGERSDPLLAVWRHGLGYSAAWTTDFLPYWTTAWASWKGTGKLLRQMVKYLTRGSQAPFTISTHRNGQTLQVRVFPGTLQPMARYYRMELAPPGRKPITRKLFIDKDQSLSAEFPLTTEGLMRVHLSDPTGLRIGSAPVAVPPDREAMEESPDQALLQFVADQTRGRVLSGQDDPALGPLPPSPPVMRVLFFWHIPALFALLLYLLDIYLRKANVFGVDRRAAAAEGGTGSQNEIYLQLATRFSNLAEEHHLRGDHQEAKTYYLRAKAFYMKAEATSEANRMWERYKRFDA